MVKAGLSGKMHPDSLGKKFAAFMAELGLEYEMHDLRRTFITRALDLNNGNATPVMLAVGHTNSAVTMAYLRDNRVLDDEVWSPDASIRLR